MKKLIIITAAFFCFTVQAQTAEKIYGNARQHKPIAYYKEQSLAWKKLVDARHDWQRQEGDQPYFGERYRGTFRRQIQLGDGLDLEHLEADLHDGVLTLRIPVAEQAKPRKVEVGQGRVDAPDAIEATTADAT